MLIVGFLINWLLLLVISYIVMEYGQYFLYDEVTPYVWAKALGGSFVLAIALTYKPISYLTMFGQDIGWTIGFGVLWFVVFTFVYQFHPPHGAAIGVIALLILAGMAEMAVSSFNESVHPTRKEQPTIFDPAKQGLRKSGGPVRPSEPSKATEEPAGKP